MNKIVLESDLILKDNEDKEIFVKEDSNLTIINEENLNNKLIFNIKENIKSKINIFDVSKNIKRNITINLNGKNSYVELNVSSISLEDCNYEVNIFHNEKNTYSQTNLHGLTINDSKIIFRNNGSIKKGAIKSELNQDNKIITLNKNNSKIEPNLFIDEYDVKASHGAYIGKFKEEDIFYLMTRGLSKDECNKLLINGFLTGNFEEKEKLEKIINKYWR